MILYVERKGIWNRYYVQRGAYSLFDFSSSLATLFGGLMSLSTLIPKMKYLVKLCFLIPHGAKKYASKTGFPSPPIVSLRGEYELEPATSRFVVSRAIQLRHLDCFVLVYFCEIRHLFLALSRLEQRVMPEFERSQGLGRRGFPVRSNQYWLVESRSIDSR